MSEWVSVKERLPELYTAVWALDNDMPFLAMRHNRARWHAILDSCPLENVTHWAPVPDAPEPPRPEDPGLTLEQVTQLIERRWPNLEKVTRFEFNYTTSTWPGRRATVINSVDAGS
jgi:hypothetical protein